MVQPGQKRNYQKESDRLAEGLQREGRIPELLLHSCYAPCSSYVLEYLSQCFGMTVYYYNPNIFPEAEYEARVKEQERPIREMVATRSVRFLAGNYEPEELLSIARGHEKGPGGGERCHRCYGLRLDRAAREAISGNSDFFTTILSINPLRNARWLSGIECRLVGQHGIPYLVSGSKEKNGYKRSVELSALYRLCRQDHCGCIYSRTKA